MGTRLRSRSQREQGKRLTSSPQSHIARRKPRTKASDCGNNRREPPTLKGATEDTSTKLQCHPQRNNHQRNGRHNQSDENWTGRDELCPVKHIKNRPSTLLQVWEQQPNARTSLALLSKRRTEETRQDSKEGPSTTSNEFDNNDANQPWPSSNNQRWAGTNKDLNKELQTRITNRTQKPNGRHRPVQPWSRED